MNYKSYDDLGLTISRNIHKIPSDIDLVVGIPRSGMIPATMIGQLLNKPVVALDSYIGGNIYEVGLYRRPVKMIANILEVKKALIIDDSINSGCSINRVKDKIKNSDRGSIVNLYAAVYYVSCGLNNIDIGFEECSWPRIFQWNILNSWVISGACVDIDGVVCVDPTEDQNDDGEKYRNFLLTASPLCLTDFKVSCFVTSRLEKYRDLTEKWLRENGFKYNELVMLDLPSKEERIKQNIHARFKAEIYKNRKEEIFIESNLSQAVQISELTGKLVFCTENMTMIRPEANAKNNPSLSSICFPDLNPPSIPNLHVNSAALLGAPRAQVDGQLSLVLFSHTFGVDGAGRSLLDLVRGLMARGVVCNVVLPAAGAMQERLLAQGCGVYVVPPECAPWQWVGWSSDTAPQDFSRAYANVVSKVLPEVQKFNPDFILSQTTVSPWGAICAGLLSTPHALSVREYGDLDHDLTFFGGFKEAVAELYRASDLVFSITQDVARHLFGEDTERKTEVIYSNIEKDSLNDGEVLEKSLDEYFPKAAGPVICLAGTFLPGKGQKDLIRAIVALREMGGTVRCLLVGAKPSATYAREVQALIDASAFADSFASLDFTPSIYSLLKQVDVVVSCARSEALGRTLIEASLLNKPIIYANSGGPKEVFQDGVHGLAYEVGDHRQLANQILKTLNNPSETQERVRTAKTYCESRFNSDNYAGKVYEKIKAWLEANAGRKVALLPALDRIQVESVRSLTAERDRLQSERDQIAADREQVALDRDRVAVDRDRILQSRSWRITRPLRWLGVQARRAQRLKNFVFAEVCRAGGWGRAADKAVQMYSRAGGVHGFIQLLKSAINRGGGMSPIALPASVKTFRRADDLTSGSLGAETVSGESNQDNRGLIAVIDFDTTKEKYVDYKTNKQIDPLVKVIAFYLPQFHPFPENDKWWGKGFTEWSNVGKAQPNYKGHYQPHCPIHFGYYDLRVPQVMEEQAKLAREYGVYGFNFYFYWFGGKVLMETPLEMMLHNPKVDMPFCLTWANENWTRRWDGQESDVLIEQQHGDEDSINFIRYLLKYFRDERYIKIAGKPVLVIYRANIIPNILETVELWRHEMKSQGFPGIYLVCAQTFGLKNPDDVGFDAAVEFPPHTIVSSQIQGQIEVSNEKFEGNIYSYEQVVDNAVKQEEPQYKLYRTAMLSWDNTARKQDHAHIFHGFSLLRYKQWLSSICHATCGNGKYADEEKFVFVNAWNEWAEGTHLEPDRRYGYGYLQATYNALSVFDRVHQRALQPGGFVRHHDYAIIIHCHYPEILRAMSGYVANLIDFGCDIFVTATTADCIALAWEFWPEANVRAVENRGRDILPFLQIYGEVAALGYRGICKVHTKRSVYRDDGDSIRDDLMEVLLGSREKIKANLALLDSAPDVGIIAPSAYLLAHTDHNMTYNHNVVHNVCREMKVAFRYSQFPAGSMFWFKPQAMKPLLKLKPALFGVEKGLADGTHAHAVERTFCVAAEAEGYRTLGIQ